MSATDLNEWVQSGLDRLWEPKPGERIYLGQRAKERFPWGVTWRAGKPVSLADLPPSPWLDKRVRSPRLLRDGLTYTGDEVPERVRENARLLGLEDSSSATAEGPGSMSRRSSEEGERP